MSPDPSRAEGTWRGRRLPGERSPALCCINVSGLKKEGSVSKEDRKGFASGSISTSFDSAAVEASASRVSAQQLSGAPERTTAHSPVGLLFGPCDCALWPLTTSASSFKDHACGGQDQLCHLQAQCKMKFQGPLFKKYEEFQDSNRLALNQA